jgi:chromate transporter
MKSLEVFWTFFKLGLTSFGGPIAHLGFFHEEFVKRKKWISENAYADLVTLCQFLPGPASSQVGMAIGLSRAGIWGSILAWIGFTLPSAIFLILLGLGFTRISEELNFSWLHGLKVAAVSIVAQAVYGMGKKLCPDVKRKIIAFIAAIFIYFVPTVWGQFAVMILAGLVGLFIFKNISELPHDPIHVGSKKRGSILLFIFVLLLMISPFINSMMNSVNINLFNSFYRAGSVVFGGGHVVLPLLQKEVVPTGLIDNHLFMVGYGASNAIPGPLFAFSAYLGAVINGVSGALVSLIAAFLPSFLLIIGVIPFWEKLRTNSKIKQSMMGINASVVGILLSALYNPVWVSAIFSLKDFLLASLGFYLLEFRKVPSWLVLILFIVVYSIKFTI